MTNEEYKAVQWLRHNHTGRQVKFYLEDRIDEVRAAYEKNEALESRRLLLKSYKTMYYMLYEAPLKELK